MRKKIIKEKGSGNQKEKKKGSKEGTRSNKRKCRREE